MSNERRLEKLAELLKHEIASIILREFDFDEALLTISSVLVSANRQQASVYVTIYPLEKTAEVFAKITRGVVLVQSQLNKTLKMRPVPKIVFRLDESEERGRHILDLLDKVK